MAELRDQIISTLQKAMEEQRGNKRPENGLSMAGLRQRTGNTKTHINPILSQLIEEGIVITDSAAIIHYRLKVFKPRST